MEAYLYQTWIYAGKHYGPGKVDLPDEVYTALQGKQAFDAPPPPELPSRSMLATTPVLAPDIAEKLAAGGYESMDMVANATDSELLAVKGIGPAALREIRALYGGGDADPD